VELMTAYLNTADQVKELQTLARLTALDVPTEAGRAVMPRDQ
jgi:hypothetical protein